MNSAGIYTVALEGYLGDCSTLVSQRIEVLPAGSVLLPDDKAGAMIKQFLVTLIQRQENLRSLLSSESLKTLHYASYLRPW